MAPSGEGMKISPKKHKDIVLNPKTPDSAWEYEKYMIYVRTVIGLHSISIKRT